jgi:hypothetical protein
VNARDGIAFLAAVRDALATPDGARLAREIRTLAERIDDSGDPNATYASRLVARAYARAETRAVTRKRS